MTSGGSNGGGQSSAFSFEPGSTQDSTTSTLDGRAHAFAMRAGESSSDEPMISVAPSGFDRESQRELFPPRIVSNERDRSRERGRSTGPRYSGGTIPPTMPQGPTGSSGLNGGGQVPAAVPGGVGQVPSATPAMRYTFGTGPWTGITGTTDGYQTPLSQPASHSPPGHSPPGLQTPQRPVSGTAATPAPAMPSQAPEVSQAERMLREVLPMLHNAEQAMASHNEQNLQQQRLLDMHHAEISHSNQKMQTFEIQAHETWQNALLKVHAIEADKVQLQGYLAEEE
jgi:hypothetical protein